MATLMGEDLTSKAALKINTALKVNINLSSCLFLPLILTGYGKALPVRCGGLVWTSPNIQVIPKLFFVNSI